MKLKFRLNREPIQEAYGNISTIKVDVTVSDSKIEAINITSQGETPLLLRQQEMVLFSLLNGPNIGGRSRYRCQCNKQCDRCRC